jgi:nitrite reductase/ring-hydroxylating ferredoxin subunit
MSMAEFIKVAETREIPEGGMKLVQLGTDRIVIANVAGSFFAFNNFCTHDQGPLAEGELDGAVVTCPWHFSQFDVTTGSVVEPPADDPVRTYPVQIDGDAIYVGRAATT